MAKTKMSPSKPFGGGVKKIEKGAKALMAKASQEKYPVKKMSQLAKPAKKK